MSRDDQSGVFKVVRCAVCGHVQLFPRPSEEQETAYYNEDRQPRSIWGNADYVSAIRVKSQLTTERRVEWVRRHSGPLDGPVLDVGCGYGWLVDALSKAGYDATGIDVSSQRFAFSTATMKGRFIKTALDEAFLAANTERFKLVCCFHVLEHLRDPICHIKSLFRLLNQNGVILVEVPNLSDEIADYIPSYAQHLWQMGHLSYFDKPRLELALRRAGAGEFSVRGLQRYGLRHLLRWTDIGCPDLEAQPEMSTNPVLERMESIYRSCRESLLTCDTLVCEIRKSPISAPAY